MNSEQSKIMDEFLKNTILESNIYDIMLPTELDNYQSIKYIEDRIERDREIYKHLNEILPNDSIFLITGISSEYTKKVSSVNTVLETISGLEFPFFAVKENRFVVYDRKIRRCNVLLLPNDRKANIILFNTTKYKIDIVIEELPIKISI